jgi:hypothetical protein
MQSAASPKAGISEILGRGVIESRSRTIDFADWERGDYSSTEWAHPEIEFVLVGELDAGSWTGVPKMGEARRRWLSSWEDFHNRGAGVSGPRR